jgi:hypothetical protein
MSNHGPFSHPDIALARVMLSDLRSFAHPDLENDYHAQRAMCGVIDKIRSELNVRRGDNRPGDAGGIVRGRDNRPDDKIIDWDAE